MTNPTHRLLAFLLAGYLSSLGSVFAAKEALLIANAEYTHFGKLPNPIPDARKLADSLRQIGFQVALVENADREQMLDALGSFEERLKASRGIAFFHYGGHGVQVNGRNYLIPANADIPDEKRVATRAVELDEVMTALDASGSAANIVVLDACRDNPLPATTRSATRGLSVVQAKPKNSIIIYAAEAGSKAQDGLFTPILANAITAPGRSITDVVMQVRREVNEKSGGDQTPGEYNQLFNPIVLNGDSQLPPPQPILNSNLPSSSIELARVEPINAARNQRQQNLQPSRQNLGAVFVNSLGQRFVPVPGIVAYFCVWHTRVSDYEKFVADTSIAWKQAGFSQAKDHPVVRVSYYDAIAFCNWLTTKETNAGLLPKGYEYRLPKDLEWSAAVGITAQEVEGEPSWRTGGLPNCYAWGNSWPPPPNSGNYDPKMRSDRYANTSPVGTFKSNQNGLFDMNGNAYQWIQESYDQSGQGCTRGGSWADEEEESINLSNRYPISKDTQGKCFGFRCVLAPK